jgi:hypothetical protein
MVSESFDGEEARRQLEELEAEPDRYREIPRAESRDGYHDMQDFIETVSDAHLRELLEVAIQGRGAFRRFKDTLGRHDAEMRRWHTFEDSRMDERARQWLADEGYEPSSAETRD